MPSANRTVSAVTPGHAYDISVGPGLISQAGPLLRALTKSTRCILISDDTVAPLHAAPLLDSLRAAAFDPLLISMPPGEHHKTLPTLLPVYDAILRWGVERSTPLLALGGGVVGDMAGFVAATLLRGVPFVQIPTTLLSMVDASVGGKTGVDHAVGKNLIGAFHQPIAVLCDVQTLRTLPPRELRSGLAECIKHDIIRDAHGFADLESSIDRALALDMDYLADLVAHNVAIKARVVQADPFERAERAHLNLGHTFGHAIESVSQFSYTHGECVALGMIAAARTARDLALIDQPTVDRIVAVIAKAQLPTGRLSLDLDAVISTMLFDKKVKSGKVRFVLPTQLGAATIRDDVPPAIVRAALESLRG